MVKPAPGGISHSAVTLLSLFPPKLSKTLHMGCENHPDPSDLGWHKVRCSWLGGKKLGLCSALHKWLPDVLQVWWKGSGCASGQVGLTKGCPFSVLRGVHLCRMRMESCMFMQVLQEILGELLTGNFLLVRDMKNSINAARVTLSLRSSGWGQCDPGEQMTSSCGVAIPFLCPSQSPRGQPKVLREPTPHCSLAPAAGRQPRGASGALHHWEFLKLNKAGKKKTCRPFPV